MFKVLTIAGSDCSGGAGIQADIKTVTAHGMYAMSAITALTAQNTTGVYGVLEASPDFVGQQLDCIFTDIFPDAVKIGMVSNPRIIEAIAEKLIKYKAKNIVIDPVMVSTSGSKLISDDAIDTLRQVLLPIGDIITPNIPESEVLTGLRITDRADMEKAASMIRGDISGAVLVKGGHLVSDATDYLLDSNGGHWFSSKRIDTDNTHGTGCTLSSAIACGLAEGKSMTEAIASAKEYLTAALSSGLDLGQGSGPLDHMALLARKQPQ